MLTDKEKLEDKDRFERMERQMKIGNALHKIQLELMIETMEKKGVSVNWTIYKRMLQKIDV